MSVVALSVQSIGAVGAADRRAPWRGQLAERLPTHRWRTRFAPAPTGYLHLGHLVNALFVWGIARRFGGDVVLRIEDHDRSRCRPEYERALLDDLDWLGLEPDDAPTSSFRVTPSSHAYRQSDRGDAYAEALASLHSRGLVYACRCTRREIAQRAPHGPGDEPRYPGTCRHALVDHAETTARRLRIDPGAEDFVDLRLGAMAAEPALQCGDLLVRDRAGHWTYQFAVANDDLAHAIDVVIRGEDLLASTARQLRVARLLGRSVPPQFLHHPLLVHDGGVKLSKANRDTALRDHRAAGKRPEALLGEAAYQCGLLDAPMSLSVRDLAMLFADS